MCSRLCHGSTFSQSRASCNPGAVHSVSAVTRPPEFAIGRSTCGSLVIWTGSGEWAWPYRAWLVRRGHLSDKSRPYDDAS
jgi:hypothetical protein